MAQSQTPVLVRGLDEVVVSATLQEGETDLTLSLTAEMPSKARLAVPLADGKVLPGWELLLGQRGEDCSRLSCWASFYQAGWFVSALFFFPAHHHLL